MGSPAVLAGPRVCILGPVRVSLDDGPGTPPSRTQRQLLAMLAVEPGRSIPADRLADHLDLSPGALRSTVGRVRRMLPPDSVVTDPVGYHLRLPVDVDCFRDLAGALAARPAQQHLPDLDAALALLVGAPLEEFRDETWAAPYVAELDELVLGTVEDRAASLLDLGRWTDAIAALEAHVRMHPLRDRAHGLLMQAYAGDGRQAESLAAYRRYRQHLADELGTEPSTAVTELHRELVRGFGGGAPRVGAAPRPRRTEHPEARFLPRYRSSFLGREADAAALLRGIDEHRLLTLTGPGGVGKTRLAASVAAAFHATGGSVWFVPLSATSDDSEVVHAVTAAVGGGVAGSAADVTAALGARRGLLVVDNCEHLLDAVAELVDDVAASCPGITVLVTSREPMMLDGERVVPLEPLPPDGAGARMFRARAEAAGAVIGSEDADVVREICRRLDGLPLAIEIAASRVAALGLHTLRDSLDVGLQLLEGPRRGSSPRHRTLTEAIDWSYRLLPPDEQRALRALGIFPDGFEIDAATAVLSAVGVHVAQVPSVVASLVDRSMVALGTQVRHDRFRLLETVRAFALDRLDRAAEREAVAEAHARWIATLTDSGDWDLYSEACQRQTVRLEREIAGWRAALAHGRCSGDVRLLQSLCGAATAMLVLGRADLASTVRGATAELPPGDPGRVCAALASWSRAFAVKEHRELDDAVAALRGLDPADSTGLARLLESARLIILTGEVDRATELRASAVDDPAVPPAMRDNVLVNSLYGTAMCARPDLERPGWRAAAERIAADSPVPCIRLVGHLALARAAATTDPEVSRRHVAAAAAEQGEMPLMLRRIWLSGLYRLMRLTDPAGAAAGLLALMEEQVRQSYLDDHTVLVACADVLASVDHPDADDVVATIALTSSAANLARTVPDTDVRRRRGRVLDHDRLIGCLLRALAQVARRAP